MSYTRVICRSGDFTTLPAETQAAVEWCNENIGRRTPSSDGLFVKLKVIPWYNSGFWFYFKNEADATLFALKWS